MPLTPRQTTIVKAYKPYVRQLLKKIRTSAEAQLSMVGEFSWEEVKYVATTTVERHSGSYQIIVELRAMAGPARALTAAEAQILVSELDSAVVAAGWTVVSGYPVSAISAFGRRITPPSA